MVSYGRKITLLLTVKTENDKYIEDDKTFSYTLHYVRKFVPATWHRLFIKTLLPLFRRAEQII